MGSLLLLLLLQAVSHPRFEVGDELVSYLREQTCDSGRQNLRKMLLEITQEYRTRGFTEFRAFKEFSYDSFHLGDNEAHENLLNLLFDGGGGFVEDGSEGG